MKQIAILGPTASGKTALSIDLAEKFNANILSLDSLSIYKEIDILSAKPSKKERSGIVHFGIDEIFVNEDFNVILFFELYNKVVELTKAQNKNLIIVGGTSFYLKSMLDGISTKPTLSEETKIKVASKIQNGYKLIKEFDPIYAQKIDKNDSYRTEKWLEIYFETGVIPSLYFKENTKKPILKNLDIFEIDIPRDELRKRIALRTSRMINEGAIDEVFFLENKYKRGSKAMKAIGIKETLDFLDGILNKDKLKLQISSNTAKLAKRQRTFNKTQFPLHVKGSVGELRKIIPAFLE